MLAIGTSQLTPSGAKLFAEVAALIAEVPNRVMIRGHTDAAPWSAKSGTNNWRLSVDRAEVTRHYLSFRGIASERRSEEHTSELQSLMRISYAVFCLKTKTLIEYNTS